MRPHYFAIRAGEPSENPIVRIESAMTPQAACILAYGRGMFARWAYIDFGTRVSAVRSAQRRTAALKDPNRWTEMSYLSEMIRCEKCRAWTGPVFGLCSACVQQQDSERA